MNDASERSQTRAKDRRLLIKILAIVFAVWGAIVIAVFAALLVKASGVQEANRIAASVDRAAAGREGSEWTLNELFSYLEAKGAVSSMVIVESGRDYRPVEWKFRTADNRTVRVRRLDDVGAAARDAKESRQPGNFSWGHFSFVGDPVATQGFQKFLDE